MSKTYVKDVFLNHMKMWLCGMVSQLTGRPAGWVSSMPPPPKKENNSKSFSVAMFSDMTNVINVKLGTMILILFTCSYHLSDLAFTVTAVSNNLNWKLNVLIWLSWKFLLLLIMSTSLWIYHCFFYIYIKLLLFQGSLMTCFLIWQKLFQGQWLSKVFQTLHHYKLAWDLPLHTRLMA